MNSPLRIGAYTEVSDLIKSARIQAKEKGKKLLSNFFPNPSIQNVWIGRGNLYLFQAENGCLLIHATEHVDEAYFFITDEAQLSPLLQSVPPVSSNPLIVEQVGKLPGIALNERTSDRKLLRFTRTGPPSSLKPVSPIDYATEGEIDSIRDIFLNCFDPVTDRIPSMHDLRELINANSVLVRRKENRIAAFLVCELAVSSIHLRYWWCSPDYRNQGLGSELMRQFFEIGKSTNRQYLWVDATNDNAIKRYRHFGFQSEGIEDYIQVLNLH